MHNAVSCIWIQYLKNFSPDFKATRFGRSIAWKLHPLQVCSRCFLYLGPSLQLLQDDAHRTLFLRAGSKCSPTVGFHINIPDVLTSSQRNVFAAKIEFDLVNTKYWPVIWSLDRNATAVDNWLNTWWISTAVKNTVRPGGCPVFRW